MPSTTLAVSAVIAVVGAGISAYGQYQSGQTQSAIASFNAQQQRMNAQMQASSMEAQASIQRSQAAANLALQQAQAQGAQNNAKAIDQQALQQDAVSRVNITRMEQQYQLFQGQQRAAIASSGVVESSGTPLDVLADTAMKIQQSQQDQGYQEAVQRNTLFSEAAQQRLGGKLALVGATLNDDSAVAAAGLQDAQARATMLAGSDQAMITGLQGQAAAQAGMYQAGGTLLSGVSGAAGKYPYTPTYNPGYPNVSWNPDYDAMS
jgi:hypothetical protein